MRLRRGESVRLVAADGEHQKIGTKNDSKSQFERLLRASIWIGSGSALFCVALMYGELQITAFAVLVFSVYRAAQHLTRSGDEVLQRDQRPAIVFCRSFESEKAKGWIGKLFSWERVLKQEIARYGPFVAIGVPTDTLPPPGVTRHYFADDEWKERFTSLLENAQLVVVDASFPNTAELFSSAENLIWEVQQTLEKLGWEKLAFFPPLNKEDYERFRLLLEGRFPGELPSPESVYGSGVFQRLLFGGDLPKYLLIMYTADGQLHEAPISNWTWNASIPQLEQTSNAR